MTKLSIGFSFIYSEIIITLSLLFLNLLYLLNFLYLKNT